MQIQRIFAFLALVAVSSCAGPQSAAPAKWNVVLLLADDLGWRDLGCTGSPFYETPSIDRLAAQGCASRRATRRASVCTAPPGQAS